MTGIEPASSVWKTEALPLSYIRAGPPGRAAGPGYRLAGAPPRHARRPGHAGWTGRTTGRTGGVRRATRLRPDGMWRRLVARPLWERKVVGSNPAIPTPAPARRPARAGPRRRPTPCGGPPGAAGR